jgi:folate-binding protein YgfZ
MISPPPQVLELNGPDAASFAHAQFCNDVLALADGHWQWNAWLSPQGRVRAFFRLQRTDAARVVLTLRGGDAEWLRTELLRFVFHARVQFAVSTGVRDSTTLADIRAGLPEIGAELRDQVLPQWIGLDRLGAVSVSKGCFPGQEIMARLHFKGGNKRSLYRLRWSADTPVPPGSVLRDSDGIEAGVIVTTARDAETGYVEALASLSDAAAGMQLHLEPASEYAIDILERFT